MLNWVREHFHKKKAISAAMACQGWTSPAKLAVLYGLAKRTSLLAGDILEIGSAWGRSAVLLGHASDKQIWSIDPHTGGRAFIDRGEKQDSFDVFIANLEKNGVNARVRILKCTTTEVIEKSLLPTTLKFSLGFIDGLHTAEGVETDFNLAFERLLPSGIMVFDDYFESTIPDYTKMIDSLAAQHNLELVRDSVSKLVYFEKS